MIRGGFLDPNIRADLIALVRDGKAETRLTRRANALLLLDDGMSCEAIAKVLYLDDDTIRYWHQLYGEKGLIWLADFGYQGRACELTAAQQASTVRREYRRPLYPLPRLWPADRRLQPSIAPRTCPRVHKTARCAGWHWRGSSCRPA